MNAPSGPNTETVPDCETSTVPAVAPRFSSETVPVTAAVMPTCTSTSVPNAGLNGANVTVCDQFDDAVAMVCRCNTVVSAAIGNPNCSSGDQPTWPYFGAQVKYTSRQEVLLPLGQVVADVMANGLTHSGADVGQLDCRSTAGEGTDVEDGALSAPPWLARKQNPAQGVFVVQ